MRKPDVCICKNKGEGRLISVYVFATPPVVLLVLSCSQYFFQSCLKICLYNGYWCHRERAVGLDSEKSIFSEKMRKEGKRGEKIGKRGYL